MNPTSMLELTHRFLNDPHFKQQMRRDPIGTAERTGLTFDDEDLATIRKWDWGPKGEKELLERVAMGFN